jgi:hypothetical protein
MELSFLDRPEILEVIFPVVYSPFYPHDYLAFAPAHGHSYSIEVEKGIKINCGFWSSDKGDPSILYFHGNGETVGTYDLETGYKGWISYGGNFYSVPARYAARRHLRVEVAPTELTIYHNAERIAVHPLCYGRHHRIIDPKHLEGLVGEATLTPLQLKLRELRALGPAAATFIDGLVKTQSTRSKIKQWFKKQEDEQNLGFIIRSAGAMSVDAILLKKHIWNFDQLTVSRTSAGVYEWMPIVKIERESDILSDLKKSGYNILTTQVKLMNVLLPDGMNSDSPWSNKLVREAAEYAIDKEANNKSAHKQTTQTLRLNIMQYLLDSLLWSAQNIS